MAQKHSIQQTLILVFEVVLLLSLANCTPNTLEKTSSPLDSQKISTGPNPVSGPSASFSGWINLAQSARLYETIMIEIDQGTEQETSSGTFEFIYVTRAKIDDKGTIDQFFELLDQDFEVLEETLACIPDYKIRFYLSDGLIAAFNCMCGEEDLYFFGGGLNDGSFSLGTVQLPYALKDLIYSSLAKFPISSPIPIEELPLSKATPPGPSGQGLPRVAYLPVVMRQSGSQPSQRSAGQQ